MALSANNHLVAFSSETVWGTDPYAGADPTVYVAFDEFSATVNYEEIQDVSVRATHSGRKSHVYGGSSSISWSLPISGIVDPSGTPSFPLAALLMASNLEQTVGAEPSFSFSPVTGCDMSRVPSLTFVNYQLDNCDQGQGRKRIYSGCRGNLTFNATMGEYATLSGSMTGKFSEFPETEVAVPANPTEYAGASNRFSGLSASLSLGGVVYPCESVELSTDWNVDENRAMTVADGTLADITLSRGPGSRPTGSLTLKGGEAVLDTILPAISQNAEFALELILTNANGDRLTITAPALQFTSYAENRAGQINYDIPFALSGTGAGEDDFTIKVDRLP